MRAFHVLLVIGTGALFFGLGVLPTAIAPRNAAVSFTIQAGSNRFARWEFDVVTGGSVSGSFVVTSAGSVVLYVMTQAQHDTLLSGGAAAGLVSAEGSSGNFSASLPGGGAYFVEFGHGSGYETVAQSGGATVTISAISTRAFAESLAGILVGAGLVGVGLRLKAGARKTAKSPAPPVGYFEPPKPPQAPPVG